MWGARGRREAQVPRAHKGPEAPQPSATTKAQGADGAPQMGPHGSAAGPKAGSSKQGPDPSPEGRSLPRAGTECKEGQHKALS